MHSMRTGDIQAEPNVVPLIDIMLVLLIVFMLLTAAQQEAMFAQIPPDSGHGDSTDVATRIILDVGLSGRYAINRQIVPGDSLGDRLRRIYQGRPDKTILVRGDGRAPYQEIVTAIDIARGAGVRTVGLWTTPK